MPRDRDMIVTDCYCRRWCRRLGVLYAGKWRPETLPNSMSQGMIGLINLYKYHHCLVLLHFFHLKIGTSIGHCQKMRYRTPSRCRKSLIEAIERYATCLERFFILVWLRETLSLEKLAPNLRQFQVSVSKVPKMSVVTFSGWDPQRYCRPAVNRQPGYRRGGTL